MERHSQLLLDIWREVCRHLEISDSLDRLAPLLTRRFPVDLILIRRLDVKRGWMDTVAQANCKEPAVALRSRTEFKEELLDRMLRWCEGKEGARRSVEVWQRELPGLMPEGLEGEALAGPLNTDEGPQGAIILLARPPRSFRAEHSALLQNLLEPFTVALENDRRVRELNALRESLEADKRSLLSRLGRHDISDSIVGAETGLKSVMDQMDLVARSDAPVLLLGETGSGKEVVARAIHYRSRRASKPFLRVNCGAIPAELVDSELFGHERGSFTGAVGARKGWFERADGGTLFMDECGELPAAAQVRLLRILQDGTFERVGGERQQGADVRIIAATHRDLQAMVRSGRFREDLWYRIAVFPIRLPSLRDRKEDIPALAAHFALRAANRIGMPALVPTPNDLNLLIAYPWPGNVRELAAVIERAAILGDGKHLEVAKALGVAAQHPLSEISQQKDAESHIAPSNRELASLDTAMMQHIEAALTRTHGRIEGPHGAAKLLRINPHTLRARMRKLKINWGRFRLHP